MNENIIRYLALLFQCLQPIIYRIIAFLSTFCNYYYFFKFVLKK